MTCALHQEKVEVGLADVKADEVHWGLKGGVGERIKLYEHGRNIIQQIKEQRREQQHGGRRVRA